jgi:hypothetical protein
MYRTIALLLSLAALPVQAQTRSLVFSELMWMGSNASGADEWIELYNRSTGEIDISGWSITRLNGSEEEIMLEFPAITIPAAGTLLIANYAADDDRSHLAVQPNIIDAAVSLANSRLLLRLYDPTGMLVDSADDGSGAPFAGDAELKHSMVRHVLDGDGSSKESWSTAVQASGWDAETAEMGTPGKAFATQSNTQTAIGLNSWGPIKASFRR